MQNESIVVDGVSPTDDFYVEPPEQLYSDVEPTNRQKSNVVYVKVPNIRSTLRGIIRFPEVHTSETSQIEHKVFDLDFSSTEKLRQIDGLKYMFPVFTDPIQFMTL